MTNSNTSKAAVFSDVEGTLVDASLPRLSLQVGRRIGVFPRWKMAAIARELGCDPANCYAYGDTATDIPFLEAFGHARAVDPDEGLEAEAKKRGWEIIRSEA